MNRLNYLAMCVAVVFACASLPIGGVHAEEHFKIGGTGGGLGTMKRLATLFEQENPGLVIDVLPSLGSSGGIKAVAAGAIDLAISSRPPKDKENDLGLMARPYAVTAMVIVTSHSDAADSLSRETLAKMYDGSITKWSDGTPIRIVLRPVRDTDTKIIKQTIPELVEGLDIASKQKGVATGLTDQEAADHLEKIPGSLGFLSLSVVRSEKRQLSVIALDGVAPTVENIESGTYPSRKTYYFVWKKPMKNATQKFIDFVGSRSAKSVLNEMGHSLIQGSE